MPAGWHRRPAPGARRSTSRWCSLRSAAPTRSRSRRWERCCDERRDAPIDWARHVAHRGHGGTGPHGGLSDGADARHLSRDAANHPRQGRRHVLGRRATGDRQPDRQGLEQRRGGLDQCPGACDLLDGERVGSQRPTDHADRAALRLHAGAHPHPGHGGRVSVEPYGAMTAPRAVGPRRGRAGFTLVELLISVVVAGVVLGAVAKLMRSQGGAYANQRALTDARETLRGGSVMLAWELRHAALGGSAFNVITSQSLGLRAIQGLGVACARGVVVPAGGAWTRRFALWNAGGDIEATSNDSALVFVSSTQKWQAFKVNQIGTPAGLGLPACGWTGTARAPAL